MKISTKGRYALRFLLDLAQHQGDGYVSLTEISQRQDLSKKYLEQIVTLLSRAKLLCASRGTQGGYRLAKPASAYTVGEILRITEGDLAPVSCLGQNHENCTRRADCPTLPLWRGLQSAIEDYLDAVTLQDLSEQNKKYSL